MCPIYVLFIVNFVLSNIQFQSSGASMLLHLLQHCSHHLWWKIFGNEIATDRSKLEELTLSIIVFLYHFTKNRGWTFNQLVINAKLIDLDSFDSVVTIRVRRMMIFESVVVPVLYSLWIHRPSWWWPRKDAIAEEIDGWRGVWRWFKSN